MPQYQNEDDDAEYTTSLSEAQREERRIEREERNARLKAGPQRIVLHKAKLKEDGLDGGLWRVRLDQMVGFENWCEEKSTPNGRIYVILRTPESVFGALMALSNCIVEQMYGERVTPVGDGFREFKPRRGPTKIAV